MSKNPVITSQAKWISFNFKEHEHGKILQLNFRAPAKARKLIAATFGTNKH